MKTCKEILLFTGAIVLALCLVNCKGKKDTPLATSMPFNAEFTCNYTYIGPDTLPNPKCAEPYTAWRAIVDGNGTGTQLGNCKVHFDFCGDSLSNYGDTYAYIVSAEGDTLFISCSGRVIEGRLDHHPAYVTSFWTDTFKISGGTGKFEGASGEGTTDDYNSSADTNSHHQWTGTITLLEAKK